GSPNRSKLRLRKKARVISTRCSTAATRGWWSSRSGFPACQSLRRVLRETHAMKCPDCGHDNVAGADECQDCGGSLWGFDPKGNEVEQGLASHPISVLCPREPVSVHPDTPVREVIASMAEKRIGCVLVEESANLLGVFTERDVLNK